MKQIKDPIYGYIDIDDFCLPLIDTAEFQRLRNIVQTGYQSLYPSALHNRFVHSIGVYHLGKKAFEKFEQRKKGFFARNKNTCRNADGYCVLKQFFCFG